MSSSSESHGTHELNNEALNQHLHGDGEAMSDERLERIAASDVAHSGEAQRMARELLSRRSTDGEAVNVADRILRNVRRFIAAENKHAKLLGSAETEMRTNRDEADLEHAALVGFTVDQVDQALRLVQRRAPIEPVAVTDAMVERAAKALVTAKGTNPMTLFQFNVFTGDEPFDHEDDSGRRFIYSWRKQVDNARAALTAALQATP